MVRSTAENGLSNPKRSLRSPDEVRQLLLDAARECFANKGYAGTSTREIALQAGVAESLLFRHFGTKAALFDQAIFEPFHVVISQFQEKWKGYSDKPHPAEVVAADFASSLFGLLHEHRELLIALLKVRRDEVGIDGDKQPLLELLQQLERTGGYELGVNHWEGVDLPIAVRIMFGSVASLAALDDWLYPTNGRRPSRERVLKECAAFFVGGTAYRGQPLRPAKRNSKTDRGHDAVDQVELARLREENERLRAECEVLKQSVAIWVREATGK